MKEGDASTASFDLAATTGGRRALAGFLLQILRSVQLGIELTVEIPDPEKHTKLVLHLEPEEGGDVAVRGATHEIVEQVKMRTPKGRWSTGEVARKVLPDLLRSVRRDMRQSLVFVTNNDAGLGPLLEYVGARGKHECLKLRWGNSRVTTAEFELRIANAVGLSETTPDLRHLLDNLKIRIVDPTTIETEIEALLMPMLPSGSDPASARLELMGRLFELSTKGARLSADDLLSLISPDARRLLAHVRSLPDLVAHHVAADAELLGYGSEKQARLSPPSLSAPLTILNGESGQGKTWTLAQSAFETIRKGGLAVILRAPQRLREIADVINERIWQPAHEVATTVQMMARNLKEPFADKNDVWLTVYIDDVQDRSLAVEIARCRWREHGVRIVVSCQPRIRDVFQTIAPTTEVVPIDDFTSSELRRFLRLHGRDDNLDTIPDDIFELLLKPVHAGVFIELENRDDWAGVTEYELFHAYWRQATLLSREQSDFPSDGHALTQLAGSLLAGQSNYPWRIHELKRAGITDEALLRLEQVGLLRRPAPDQIMFATDRMLNWAVAEHIAAAIKRKNMSPVDADQLLAEVEGAVTVDGTKVGNRLGYVYFDAFWLLIRELEPAFIAELVRLGNDRARNEAHTKERWENGFGSLGSGIVPVLETLAPALQDDDWELVHGLPFALAAAGRSDPGPVRKCIKRLFASGSPAEIVLAMRTACFVPAPEALDDMWIEHLRLVAECDRQLGSSEPQSRFDSIQHQEVSGDAVGQAIAVDPEWLSRKLGCETDAFELNQLVWRLNNLDLTNDEMASEIWTRNQDHVSVHLPITSKAYIAAIRRFKASSYTEALAEATIEGEEDQRDRVLRTRARLDPSGASKEIADGGGDYGWSAANWWFDDLLAADQKGLSRALRLRARRSEDPMTDLILYYRFNPNAMDRETLALVLDGFTTLLSQSNERNCEPDGNEGRLHHALRFLPQLVSPAHFAALRDRAGTDLERELTAFAVRRDGRRSMIRDTTGNECERILAMIGGTGFAEHVVAQLRRKNRFGRQDGLLSSLWTEDPTVTQALADTEFDADGETFGAVARMNALAVHGLDDGIEEMIASGTPIFVNAAEMRSSHDRDLTALRARIAELLRSGDPESLDMASALTGFMSSPEDAASLLPFFLRSNTSVKLRRRMLASFRALGFYSPDILPLLETMLRSDDGEEVEFIASYLARFGDADARKVAVDWLGEHGNLGSGNLRQSLLAPLLEHEDTKAAALKHVETYRGDGGLIVDGVLLRYLADEGDRGAREELLRATHRVSGMMRNPTREGILYLARSDPDEAYLMARRWMKRRRATVAIDLLLQLDAEKASIDLVDFCRNAEPSMKFGIRRRLRLALGGEDLAALIEPLAAASTAPDRKLAAYLATDVPPACSLDWLDDLASDRSEEVVAEARAAIVGRELEAHCMEQIAMVSGSPKPMQWALLSTIIENVDPVYLWSRSDPASLGTVLAELPHEFFSELENTRSRARKAREDAAKKEDRRS